jgi:FixJ family two-component response regulator
MAVSFAAGFAGREMLDTLVSRQPRPKYCILRRMINRMKVVPAVRPLPTKVLVSVVDDDESVRESLPDLLKEFGFRVQAFASADEFLASGDIAGTRCLILDVAMPGMSGPELQRELANRGERLKIIFITARGDEAVRKQLVGRGAVDCLFKPFSEQQLRAALDAALQDS